MPITIDQAMQHIKRKEYLLPAFQRDFVWSPQQIEKLFDSLMRDYPTNSMLFGKLKEKQKLNGSFMSLLALLYKMQEISKY